ncbi:MAG: phenylacetate--CoA ligase family protein [Candidatus Thorarchaeota archaeon]|nr:phenylacetate--CoA ligase family protein [Candidatus Thorarchaeota archaeon]
MFRSLTSSYFYSKFFLLNTNSSAYYERLIRNQCLSSRELAELNWRKRKKLLRYAYKSVPFYRRKFKAAGIIPDDVKTPDDFLKIPFLTKNDIRENLADIMAMEVDKRYFQVSTTGGSTGIPLRVYHDRRVPLHAIGWRLLARWDLAPWDDGAFVFRDVRQSRFQDLAYCAFWWPTKRVLLDAASMTESSIRCFIRKYKCIKPRLLQGYVGAICHLAEYVDDHCIELPPPKAVWLTSSPISEVQRNLVEKVFNAPVYDQYGCGEVYWLAAECNQHTGLHIESDIRHIEFVKNGEICAEGEFGDIVVTDLENYAFPIIRYLNEDRGRLIEGQCPCGLPFPLMDHVRGRESDMIRLPNGTVLSGDFLTTIFDACPEAVKMFQFIQNADYSIVLRFVPNKSYRDYRGAIGKVRNILLEKTQQQVPVLMEATEDIPSQGGKLKFIISKLS